MSEDSRPNPDSLLGVIKKQEISQARGKLCVFFGMCPGVGKTYAMLRVAVDLHRSGKEVVAGVVETHGREETQNWLRDLTIIPKRKITYKDSTLEEFDLDAILLRKPDLVLIDELAHTNAPGCRHPKRYQDVLEILNQGINVYTTLNVQHIESRADLIEQITKVPIRETVPDSILEGAQFQLIDLSPGELLKRLEDGKVYLGSDRIQRAGENFFKYEHLTALREISLRYIAEQVDDELQDQMVLKQVVGPWNTKEKLLVAISHSPYSGRLIRASKRKAKNLNAPWIALYVEQGDKLSVEDETMLTRNMNLAKELGAELYTTRDINVAKAIKRVATEKNVTQIIIGRPDRRLIRDIFSQGTLLDQLVRETSEVDVHVMRQQRKPHYRRLKFHWPTFSTGLYSYYITFIFMTLVSVLSYGINSYIGYRATGFIFLLAVLVISSFASFGPIFFAAFFSSMVWNFFYIQPTLTFSVSSYEDIMMILAYFITAIVAGILNTRIRKQEKILIQREHKANILYELGKRFAEIKGEHIIVSVALESINHLFNANSAALIINNQGELSKKINGFTLAKVTDKDIAVAEWSFINRKKAGFGTDTLNSSPCVCIPLLGRTSPVGVLLIYPQGKKKIDIEQENLLETVVNNLAIALEREIFETKAKQAELLQESEKLHQTILNSVSHELRTPLTSIIGAATALKDTKTAESSTARETLTDELVNSSQRLNRVIENLLDMSRIQSGVLKLNEQIIGCNELLESTSKKFKIIQTHQLVFQLANQEIYCKGDYRLLEHVFINLLTNAQNYSPPGTKIEIETFASGNFACIAIKDEGPGISDGNEEKIFEKFFRISGTPTGGIGLGLSIVKGIVEAHKGMVSVETRKETKGSVFLVKLPLQQIPINVSKGIL